MTADHSPAGVGAKLREARERRGVSLSQVAESTKISVSFLQALERNDISWLPGGLFGRGFVRAYATAVGLDPEETVAEFVAQFPSRTVSDGYPAAEQQNASPDTQPSKSSSKIRRWEGSTLLRLAAVAVLPTAFVAYFGTTKRWPQRAAIQSRADAATTKTGQEDNSVRLDGPTDNSVRAAGSDESSVQAQGSSEPSAGSAALDRPAEAKVLANFAGMSGVPTGADSTPVAASSAPTVAAAPDSPPAKAERGEKPGALVGDRLVVVVSVTRPSWMIATVDGKKTVNRLLQVDEQETIEVGRDLVFTAGDAGAVVMTINGAAAKSLGATGETVTVRVSPTNFRNYLRRD